MATTYEALTCPECDKTFTRAAALGAHRSQIHGVAGTSKKKKRGRPSTNGKTNGFNPDAILKQVFPNGMPPKVDVILAAEAWLDEGRRLAALR